MFPLSSESDESAYRSFSPASGSEYGTDSRSGSQSPSTVAESNTAGPSLNPGPVNTSKGSRKRRAQLLPINLGTAGETEELSAETPSTSSSNAPEEEPNTAVHVPRPTSLSTDPYDKRIRLASSSSTSSTNSLLSLIGDNVQSPLVHSDSLNDFVGCESSTPSAKFPAHVQSGAFIADGEFQLFGSGSECNALHVPSQTIHYCSVLHKKDYNCLIAVIERIEEAKRLLTAEELREVKRMILPDELRIVTGQQSKTWYVITPDHQGSLHTFYNTENPTATQFRTTWTERDVKVIFRQVVRLVALCHKIGIYFGDFRLQKLAYTDSKNSQIRLLHLRNVCVSPLIENDTFPMTNFKCIPAFLPPELSVRSDSKLYQAKKADVWSLGILLFVLLTGRYPFTAPNPRQLASVIRSNQFSFRSTEKISRSARLLVYGLIRYTPMERPSGDEILMSDWFYSQTNEAKSNLPIGAFRTAAPHVTIQVNMPTSRRLVEANPRIPQQLLGVLVQSVADRNTIYARQANIRASMEAFANEVNAGTDAELQTVPSGAPVQLSCNTDQQDSLGITVVRVCARR